MNRLHFLAVGTLWLCIAVHVQAAEPLSLVQTIPLKGMAGKLDHLAIDAKGERLFVANKPNNTLDIVDLKAGALSRQISGQGKVSGVTYARDLDMIYVGNGAGFCNAFDGKDYHPAFSTPAAGADNVHYNPSNKLVYVGHGDSLSALDSKSGVVKASTKMPGDIHGFRVDRTAGKIYLVVTKPSLIVVVDIATNEVTDKWPLTLSDGGSPIAQDRENGLLFVGCPKKPMVVVFDIKSGKEVSSIAIPAGVDDVQFDAKRHRLYASCSDRALIVLQQKGSQLEQLASIETPLNSRTCAWVTDRLYLGVPAQEGKGPAEVRVYQAAD